MGYRGERERSTKVVEDELLLAMSSPMSSEVDRRGGGFSRVGAVVGGGSFRGVGEGWVVVRGFE